MPWYKTLHWQILLGLIAGLLFGIISILAGFQSFTEIFVAPVGTIFIRMLQLVAIPLVIASLIVGITNLNDITKLSRMGGKTIGIYMMTTVFAITIGLTVVNVFQPGKVLPEETRDALFLSYKENIEGQEDAAAEVLDRNPLQFIVDIVPPNFFASISDNANMLQVVFMAVIIGIALMRIPEDKSRLLIGFFDALNDVVIKIVELIMKIAPYGVFALIASVITDLGGDDLGATIELLRALLSYGLVVIAGLILHMSIVYTSLFKWYGNMKMINFLKGIRPAQLLGFSTSSSLATLPLTMNRVEKKLGVHEEVASFVLPVGATINMDGTSLYQAVAAVFIAQAVGIDLSLSQQLIIVLTATLASIGTAGVPGAGIIMLVIVLQAVEVPVEGIALILGVDRILDMCRTAVNITGDAAVSVVVASSEGKLGEGAYNE
ncbi:dicarboxylate/amino acid:cation symporter [Balneolaceae bacterium ANBcel3]|nr:dicarboxylate/amino acid:cation symporter [Balneolaceae bacterium ANBcel3]